MSGVGVARRRLRPVAWLEIDGFPTAFYSGAVPPPTPSSLAGRVLQPGLKSWSGTSSRLSLTEAVAEAGGLTVLVTRTATNGAADLLRKAPFGAQASSTLATTMLATATAVAVVCADPIDAFPAAGVLHIGQEAISYPSKDNATRTFAAGSRARLGSQFGAHVVDQAVALAPRVFSDCVSWLRRPARLWIADRRPDGVWVDPVCELDGFIDGVPEPQADGAIEIRLTSVVSALDAEIGGSVLQAGLQHGWHAFDGAVGDRFDLALQIYTAGSVLDAELQGGSAAGSELLTLAHGRLDQTFDLGATDGPQAGYLVTVAGEQLTPLGVGGDQWDGTGTVVLATGEPLAPLNDGEPVQNARAEIRQSVTCLTAPGTPEVLSWPAGAFAAFGAGLALPVTAAGGSFALSLLDPAGSLSVLPYGAPGLRVRLMAPTRRTCWGLRLGGSLPAIVAGRIDHDWPTYAPGGPHAAELYFDAEPTEAQAFTWGGVASAWYQPGERWLLADADIFSGGVPARPLTVLATTQWRGEEVRVLRRVTGAVAASTITAGAAGTLAEVHPSDRGGLPLADLPGEAPTVLQAVAAFRDVPPTEVMLRLLLSVGGTGANSVHDVLPFGAGLRPAQVDEASFTGFGEGAFPRRTFLVEEGIAIRELISSLARSIGAVVVERLNRATGRRRIGLAPAGLPTALDAVAAIGDGTWLVDGRPRTTTDDALINRVVFKATWQPVLGYGRALDEVVEVTVGVTDNDSAPANGGAQAEDLNLLGAELRAGSAQAQRAAVLPIATERFASFGYPRPRVSGSLPYGDAVGIDAGAVVLLWGPEVVGYDGRSVGAPGLPARVTSVDRDANAAKATIEATLWGVRTSGWAPAMQVQGVLSTTVVDVVPSHYAPAEGLDGATQYDPDLFAVGDAVLCVPLGDRASATSTTITAKGVGVGPGAANRITFAVPHGLVAGDTIRSQAYTAVSARLQAYAHQADATTLLLGGADATQRYT